MTKEKRGSRRVHSGSDGAVSRELMESLHASGVISFLLWRKVLRGIFGRGVEESVAVLVIMVRQEAGKLRQLVLNNYYTQLCPHSPFILRINNFITLFSLSLTLL